MCFRPYRLQHIPSTHLRLRPRIGLDHSLLYLRARRHRSSPILFPTRQRNGHPRNSNVINSVSSYPRLQACRFTVRRVATRTKSAFRGDTETLALGRPLRSHSVDCAIQRRRWGIRVRMAKLRGDRRYRQPIIRRLVSPTLYCEVHRRDALRYTIPRLPRPYISWMASLVGREEVAEVATFSASIPNS